MLTANDICCLYAKSTKDEREAGAQWYPNANAYCDQLAFWYDRPLWKVVAILSALSPQCSWNNNQTCLEAFLNGDLNRVRRGCLGYSIEKAQLIDSGAKPYATAFPLKTAPKTNNFYHNILTPADPRYVTIDTHMARMAGALNNSGKFKYAPVADIYLTAAKQIGVIPSELQATLWLMQRDGMQLNFKLE